MTILRLVRVDSAFFPCLAAMLALLFAFSCAAPPETPVVREIPGNWSYESVLDIGIMLYFYNFFEDGSGSLYIFGAVAGAPIEYKSRLTWTEVDGGIDIAFLEGSRPDSLRSGFHSTAFKVDPATSLVNLYIDGTPYVCLSNPVRKSLRLVESYPAPDAKPTSIAYDGAKLIVLGAQSNMVYAVSTADGSVLGPAVAPATATALEFEYIRLGGDIDLFCHGIAVSGGEYYLCGKPFEKNVYRFSDDGFTAGQAIVKGGAMVTGLGRSNGRFYAIESSPVIGQEDIDPFSLVEYDDSWRALSASPTPVGYGLADRDGELWGVEPPLEQITSVVSTIDPETGRAVEGRRYASPVEAARGLAWDGEFFWLTGNGRLWKCALPD